MLTKGSRTLKQRRSDSQSKRQLRGAGWARRVPAKPTRTPAAPVRTELSQPVEPAPVRTEFLAVLRDRLSTADEEFLETALDDRARDVRRLAAEQKSPAARLPVKQQRRRVVDAVTLRCSYNRQRPGAGLLLLGWQRV